MKIQSILILLLFVVVHSQLTYSQDLRSIEPYKVSEKITVDAIFDEEAWSNASIAKDFIQTQPSPKEPSTEKTEVQVAYDDKFIYVAAKLLKKESTPFYMELGQIDDLEVNAESFLIFLDTFNDDQNGFAFGLTSAGVQVDSKYSPNGEDFTWDGVWESKVRIDEKGWYVEMKIPMFNLRFTKQENQDWGINFLRNIRYNREQAFWNHVDQNVNGFVNQWGQLSNIEISKVPLRLFFTPFVSNDIGKSTGNPAQSKLNAGLDLKYGINESFTLDFTLIPDFGGVRSDEQILNLGPFEQAFDENRAFFTEGIELFGKNNLFQSRRIGQRPSGFNNVNASLNDNEIVDFNPSNAQLLNATKISGRTKGNLGIGFFNAITGKSEATIRDTLSGEIRSFQTGALTNYNILVAEQSLKNASTIHIINTNVNRADSGRDANVTGIGGVLRDKTNTYQLETSLSLSQIFTSNEFDLRESEKGFSSSVQLSRNKGKWNFGIGSSIRSETFDPNDLGLLFGNNENNQFAFAGYNQNEQKDWYRSWGVRSFVARRALYSPAETTGYRYSLRGNLVLNNLLAIFGRTFHSPGDKDFFEPQVFDFETFFRRPSRTFSEIGISSDYSKKIALDASIERGFGQDDIPIDVWNYTFAPRFRFNDKLLTVLTYENSSRFGNAGFAAFLENDTPLFGIRDRIRNQTELNTEYRFNNKMNISIFGRYTWDTVEYESFNTLDENGNLNEPYLFRNGEIAPENINFSAFNLDAVFRWRYAQGSDLSIVYQKQLSETQETVRDDIVNNFGELFQQDHLDGLNIKAVFFLDYNTLRKKKK